MKIPMEVEAHHMARLKSIEEPEVVERRTIYDDGQAARMMDDADKVWVEEKEEPPKC